MAKDLIFGEEFTARMMKSSKLEKHLPKVLKENSDPKAAKKATLEADIRRILREELAKAPGELEEDPMGEAVPSELPGGPSAGGEFPPAEGGEMGGEPAGELPPAEGDEMSGEVGGGPLDSVNGSLEGIDWASVSDEDVEALIQDIASRKWGDQTDTEFSDETASEEEPMAEPPMGGEAEDPLKKMM
jgi:hypothetical protein